MKSINNIIIEKPFSNFGRIDETILEENKKYFQKIN